MSTGTTRKGPQATQEAPAPEPTATPVDPGATDWEGEFRVLAHSGKLKGIIREALKDADSADISQGDSAPPFHTSVVWADVFSPSGVKFHVVVRSGARQDTVTENLLVAHNALETLMSEAGWLAADRLPQTPEQIKANTEAMEKRFTEATAAQASKPKAPATVTPQPAAPKVVTPPQPTAHAEPAAEGAATRTMVVSEIFKGMTQKGTVQYKVKGIPWQQYGVTCWPDSGQIWKLGGMVDLNTWGAGQTVDFTDTGLLAIVKLKEEGKPDKVIDWTGPMVVTAPLDGNTGAES